MASGISDAQLAVFVLSLRLYNTPSTTAIVLFMDEISPKAKEIMDEHVVEGLLFDASSFVPVHPSTYRWPMISEEVARRGSGVRNVLVADIRDMAVQGDPFSVVRREGEGLHVFTGVEHITLGKDGWNGGWVRDCFGEGLLNRIKDEVRGGAGKWWARCNTET